MASARRSRRSRIRSPEGLFSDQSPPRRAATIPAENEGQGGLQ